MQRAHYQAQAVETASPAQLVLMLYDGALAALTRARVPNASLEQVNRGLLKAQDIVTELQVTLDRDRGGEIAASLSALYAFCMERLVEANLGKDLSLLDAVEAVLRDVRDAWEAACCGATTLS